MAQNIKYCDPSLTTGDDDGRDKANAWKTLAAANTGAAANDRVRVRSNVGGTAYELTANPGVNFNVAGTAGEPRTFIAFDWDTDTEVDQTNWHGYGGTIGVLINYNNAGAGSYGIQAGASFNQVIGFEIAKTGAGMGYGMLGFGGVGSTFYLCKSTGAGQENFWEGSTMFFLNCMSIGGVGGFRCTNGAIGCVASGSSGRGFQASNATILRCLAIGCGVGVEQTGGAGIALTNCGILNCAVGLRFTTNTRPQVIENAIIEGSTTGIDVQTTAKNLTLRNVSHYNNTNLYGGTALATSFIEEEGVYESTVSLFKNIAGGDYSNNPNAAVLKQYQNRLLENTYDWTQPGLGQPMVAGGGGGGLKPNFPQLNVQRW